MLMLQWQLHVPLFQFGPGVRALGHGEVSAQSILYIHIRLLLETDLDGNHLAVGD